MTEASSNDPRRVVASYLASFATRGPALIASHVADEFVNEHTAALGQGCVGKAAYLERLPSFLADMVDLTYEAEHIVVEGAHVAAFYLMRARWQGEAAIEVRGVQHLVVHNSLIVHRTDYWDSAVFLTQASPKAKAALAVFGVK